MSRRERMRRRKRHRGGGSSRVAFLVLGVVTTGVAIGALAVAGWVIGMMASAPELNTIKPVEQGQSSVVYAADGQRLGFIQADTLRTPVPRGDPDQPAQRDGRDRGPPLLLAQGRRRRGRV